MNKQQTYITPEAKEHIKVKKFNLEAAEVLSQNPILYFQSLQKIPQKIYIYDAGFNGCTQIVPIRNHINKTGINILRNEQNKKITFYDITNIYQKQPHSRIAECFGNHVPKKTNHQYTQARFLCNYVIAAHHVGIKEIFAYIVD